MMKQVVSQPRHIFFTFFTIIIMTFISLQVILILRASGQPLAPIKNEVRLQPTPAMEIALADITPIATIEPTVTITANPSQTPSQADLRLGYIDRGLNCPLITEISELVLEQKFGLSVELIEFDTPDELFVTLASTTEAERIDLTLCFWDPKDRPYISKYFGFTKQLGGAYWQDNSNKLLIMANAAIVAPLEKEAPCIYAFFQNIKFEEPEFEPQDAAMWINEHRKAIRSWTSCEAN
ncbi:MAG: hypothetical protein ACPGWR_11570 [Ardenticatenaceae bacterium]